MTRVLSAITEALPRRALRAAAALSTGVALLCVPVLAQGAQLLGPGEARLEGAGLVRGAPLPGRDVPAPAVPKAVEGHPTPADTPSQGRGGAVTASLSPGTATVTESGEARTVAVTARPGGVTVTTDEVAARLAIGKDGTVAEGVDYAAVAAIPASPPPPPLTGDTTVEADETLVVTDTAPGNNAVPAMPTAASSARATAGVSRRLPRLSDSERGRHFSVPSPVVTPANAALAPVTITMIDDMAAVSTIAALGDGSDGFGASPGFGGGRTITAAGSGDLVTVSFTEGRFSRLSDLGSNHPGC